jgi:Cys-rich protein (TIGR01571 family)
MTLEYGNGIFGCFTDIPLCLCSIVCAPWVFAKTTAKIRSEDFTIFHCCNATSPWYHRKDIGKEKGLDKDCIDCLVTILLCPCSLCQNARAASVKPFELN